MGFEPTTSWFTVKHFTIKLKSPLIGNTGGSRTHYYLISKTSMSSTSISVQQNYKKIWRLTIPFVGPRTDCLVSGSTSLQCKINLSGHYWRLQPKRLAKTLKLGASYRIRTYSPERTVLQTAATLQLSRERIKSFIPYLNTLLCSYFAALRLQPSCLQTGKSAWVW